MGWHVGHDLAAHERAVRAFLESDPVGHTLQLSLLAGLTAGVRWGDAPEVFAEHTATSGEVDGAAIMTPPHPVVISGDADPAGLVTAMDGVADLAGVNALEPAAIAVGAAWTARYGGATAVTMRLHLLELFRFDPPPPAATPGRVRPALEADSTAVHALIAAMQDELGEPRTARRLTDDRIAARRVWVRDVEGEPVATASATAAVGGAARIVAVYTVPAYRGRRLGSEVTAACVAAQLAAGVPRLCLFTDAADPTPNGIYERLGFRRRPVDLLRLAFGT